MLVSSQALKTSTSSSLGCSFEPSGNVAGIKSLLASLTRSDTCDSMSAQRLPSGRDEIAYRSTSKNEAQVIAMFTFEPSLRTGRFS